MDDNIENIISLIKQNHQLIEGIKYKPLEQVDKRLPIFKIKFEQEYELEGGLLSIVKRKVMNYIFQTIKISELKE